jgi:hypothetical protein
MIEYVRTNRQLFTAMQVTERNWRGSAEDGLDIEPPLSDWVIAWTGCDGLWGGGSRDCDLAFDDSCGREWFRGRPYANYGDWLVLGEDGVFFFVPQHVFEILFEVEGENICRECRYVQEPHVGPGTVFRDPKVVKHHGDCPTVAWLKPTGSIEPTPGFRDDREWRHPDLIG